jgi:hypothetical protein
MAQGNQPDSANPADEDDTLRRIENLPRDVGWLMVYMGVVGVIVPGIPGGPFFIAAAAVLAPGGPKLMSRWAGGNPSGFVRTSLKQVLRFVDDLEHRYPRL